MKKLVFGIFLISMLVITSTAFAGDKVYVCKYVGTPGDDETLQTGNNPIEVSVNTLPSSWTIGGYFNDSQGRSYVLGNVPMVPAPTGADCPQGSNPPTDVCSNIDGNQESVPAGYELVNGLCVLIVDVCSNIDGNQATVPAGYTVENGVCVLIPVCEDTAANNIGQPLPCTYTYCPYDGLTDLLASDPLCVAPPGVCADQDADNWGEALPCTYTYCPYDGLTDLLASDPLCVAPPVCEWDANLTADNPLCVPPEEPGCPPGMWLGPDGDGNEVCKGPPRWEYCNYLRNDNCQQRAQRLGADPNWLQTVLFGIRDFLGL